MLDPFYAINEKRYASLSPNPNTEAPVFILGHWRSGTTFVHNVLSCDDSFGCCSTYQTVFPHLMLWGRPFFKRCMSLVMPSERPTDSMALGVDLPQEEEFALSNMTACAHYHFWMFPRRMAEYRDKYLTFTTATEAERQEFMQALDKLIRISLHVTGKKRFLSKNPPHTGRIKPCSSCIPMQSSSTWSAIPTPYSNPHAVSSAIRSPRSGCKASPTRNWSMKFCSTTGRCTNITRRTNLWFRRDTSSKCDSKSSSPIRSKRQRPSIRSCRWVISNRYDPLWNITSKDNGDSERKPIIRSENQAGRRTILGRRAASMGLPAMTGFRFGFVLALILCSATVRARDVVSAGERYEMTAQDSVVQSKSELRQMRRDSIRRHKNVWISMLGGPSYTPEASFGIGGAMLTSFRMNKADTIS